MTRPRVSVVVPYYEREDQLDRLLTGLDLQTLPPEDFEVVVADDGSSRAPRLGRRRYRTQIVIQPDRGFRSAAARNLGADVSTGTVLVFLDQDVVPAPPYLELVSQAVDSPWSLVVGHRLHTDLEGWSGSAVAAWLSGTGPSPPTIPEPSWLLEGYARTDALTRPDEHSYQLVIAAVLSMHRELFRRLGGFDPGFTRYGGEDWEIGNRAFVAGADMRWLADAQAWHDGPDLAGRAEDLVRAKNVETLALGRRLPHSDVRGETLLWQQPQIVVQINAAETDVASLVASVDSLLSDADAHAWLGDSPAAHEVAAVLEDPRVHVGAPAADIMARARHLVTCGAVVVSGGSLRTLQRVAPIDVAGFRMVSVRDENRARRGIPPPSASALPDPLTVTRLTAPPSLERLWQQQRLRDEVGGPVRMRPTP